MISLTNLTPKMKDNKFYPEESPRFAQAIESLKGHRVAVLGHQRPDGDCIGSTVAVVRLLKSLGIEAIGLNQDATPSTLEAFVGDTPMALAADFTSDGHIAVSVDCADYKRVGDRLNELFPEVALNVDHHISNKLYGAENLVIATACATAEILAGFCLDNGYEIDAVTAQALYVGIATDTGQFRFPSTTPDTFEIARRLCECGAQPAVAAYELYECESFSKIKLLQNFLDSLTLEFGGRVCVGLIENGVYEATGATIDDSEGLVDYARAIAGVDIGVMIEDRAGALKGSLRAKDPKFRVDQVAKLFGGGGHACAAGLNVEDSSIKAFYPQLMAAIGEHLKTTD
jgi:bifunctional oligoribonuclease and PAP phosphatase NrnA